MTRQIAYVSCAAESAIVLFGLDGDSGALIPRGRVRVPGPTDPVPTSMALALSPDRRALYAACRNPPFPVSAFAIGDDGGLTLTGTGHLAASMAYLATDRSGRFLLGASYHGARLAVTPVGADGVPGEPVAVLVTPPKAHSILPDPENRAVYAAVLGGDVILRQPFDPATGALGTVPVPVARSAAGAGPRHLRFARGGTLLYCVNELDATLTTYARDPAGGVLTELQSLRLVPPPASGTPLAGADLHLTPDERFLYASERSCNVLCGFRLREDGTLEALGSVAAEPVPRGFAITPDGRFLLCAGQQSGAVASYRIDPESGALSRCAAAAAGGNATWIEIVALPG
ncbi:Lactonase family protein [Rhodovastum atsumiense]|uniref:Lactonase family protein n=1 Tax=Rhodovastum atsumiense TaxID=504468 RepID=A0A5M6IQF1_9PROT|nr:beta-propeller fold lactonase family protein [Rhodovastum atsumiense]KAA5609788.1 lactonase family protein [Rhodovastum atsumiense]CAH2599429.1 Lactonase family protein [Rhodovastum atsumiense]